MDRSAPRSHTGGTVRSAVLDLLRGFGIDTVFGNPGSTELPFFDRFPNDFRYILALQEAAAVAMADGYAQATRNAAFVNLHSAAGVGHALGNIFNAYRNASPMVIVAGQQTRALLPLHPFLYSEAATEFPKPYVKWSVEPARAEDVPAAIARAFHTAMAAPCGPCLVSVPADDWTVPTGAPPPVRRVSRDVAPDPALLTELAAALRGARRPALVVGSQIDQEGVWPEVIRLAERTRAAVWEAPFASRANFPEDHRLFQGFLPPAPGPVGAALAPYDLVVVLGAPVFTFHVAGECGLFERDVGLFQVTDDPASAARAAIGTSLVGSLRLALPGLIEAVGECDREPPPHRPAAPVPEPSCPIRAEYLLHRLSAATEPDEPLFEEVPSHRPAMQAHLPFRRPGTFHTVAAGGLGWALPASVGAALARPDRRVTCLVGDGSAMYTFQGLWTAVQHGLPVTVVVLNNRGYGAMRSIARTLGVANAPGTELPGLDFVSLAAGLGCPGRRVERPDEVADALRQARAGSGPFLLEVEIDPAIPHLYDRQEA